MTVTVVLCAVAPVAVLATVTVYVPSIEFCGGAFVELPPQPQVVSATNTANNSQSLAPRLRVTGIMNNIPMNPKLAPVSQPIRLWTNLAGAASVDAEVAIVMVVVEISVSLGVTMLGEKLQVAPFGNPEQVKLTACLKPPRGTTDISVAPEEPNFTEIAEPA